LLWQILATAINNVFYFASPVSVAVELWHLAKTTEFWLSIYHSLIRILGGFFIAFILGILVAFLACRCKILKELLEPFVNLLKSVPVAAVVVVLLIWFGSRWLVLCVTFMVVFPNVYFSVWEGLMQVDVQMKEVALVFRIPWWNRLLYLYRMAVCPYLLNSVRICIGMSFKSGVAAEIIGLPENSMGEALYGAKIYLNTAGVFAWTIVIIGLSTFLEKILEKGLKWLGEKEITPKVRNSSKRERENVSKIQLHQISKSYGEHSIFAHWDQTFEAGNSYCIVGESGCGKTTLLRIIAGLDSVTDGTVNQYNSIGMVFQESRLLLNMSAKTNLLFAGCSLDVIPAIKEVLPVEAWEKPLREYSGGMLQKIAILRALYSDSGILLMDEPFSGMDEENRKVMIRYIKKHQEGRTLLVVTHNAKDAILLEAELIELRQEERSGNQNCINRNYRK